MVGLDIGPQVELASGDQQPRRFREKRRIENPPLVMPLLPPGVGEVDVNPLEPPRTVPVRQILGQHDPRVGPQQLGVGQVPFLKPTGRPLRFLQIALDPQKVSVGTRQRRILQEQPPPRPDLQFRWLRLRKKARQGKWWRRQPVQCLKPAPQIIRLVQHPVVSQSPRIAFVPAAPTVVADLVRVPHFNGFAARLPGFPKRENTILFRQRVRESARLELEAPVR